MRNQSGRQGPQSNPALPGEQAALIAALRHRARPRFRSPLGHHLLMGALGLACGLTVVVPVVLGLTGRLPGFERANRAGKTAARIEAETRAKPLKPLLVSVPRPADRPPVDPVAETDRAITERIDTARALIERSDVLRARAILAEPGLGDVAEAAFLLAETFDPNVLAARNPTGITADADRARQLYDRALAGGIAQARQRLDALR